MLTNTYNKVLYIGVTSNLGLRVAEHKAKINKDYTYRYNRGQLVYFEVYPSITDANSREKQLKNWKRAWKDELINVSNLEWGGI